MNNISFSSVAAVSPQSNLEDGEVVEVQAEATPHQPVSAPPPALQAPKFQFSAMFRFLHSVPGILPPDRQIAASSG